MWERWALKFFCTISMFKTGKRPASTISDWRIEHQRLNVSDFPCKNTSPRPATFLRLRLENLISFSACFIADVRNLLILAHFVISCNRLSNYSLSLRLGNSKFDAPADDEFLQIVPISLDAVDKHPRYIPGKRLSSFGFFCLPRSKWRDSSWFQNMHSSTILKVSKSLKSTYAPKPTVAHLTSTYINPCFRC